MKFCNLFLYETVEMLRVNKELQRRLQAETGQRQAPKSKEWLVELIKLGLNISKVSKARVGHLNLS